MKSTLCAKMVQFALLFIFVTAILFIAVLLINPLLADVAADSSGAKSGQSIGRWIEENAVLASLIGIALGAVLTGLIRLLVNWTSYGIEHRVEHRFSRKEKKNALKTEEDRYLNFVVTENEKLAFHGFETKVRVPILLWDVYVPLRANLAGINIEHREVGRQRIREHSETRDISIEEAVILAKNRKYDGLIILGDPEIGMSKG